MVMFSLSLLIEILRSRRCCLFVGLDDQAKVIGPSLHGELDEPTHRVTSGFGNADRAALRANECLRHRSTPNDLAHATEDRTIRWASVRDVTRRGKSAAG